MPKLRSHEPHQDEERAKHLLKLRVMKSKAQHLARFPPCCGSVCAPCAEVNIRKCALYRGNRQDTSFRKSRFPVPLFLPLVMYGRIFKKISHVELYFENRPIWAILGFGPIRAIFGSNVTCKLSALHISASGVLHQRSTDLGHFLDWGRLSAT